MFRYFWTPCINKPNHCIKTVYDNSSGMRYLNKLVPCLRSNNSTKQKICQIYKSQRFSLRTGSGLLRGSGDLSMFANSGGTGAQRRGAMGTRNKGWGWDDVIRVGELGQWHRSPLPPTAPSRRPPVDINPCVRCIPDNASTLNWLGQCSLSLSLFLCLFQLLCSIDLIQATFVLALSISAPTASDFSFKLYSCPRLPSGMLPCIVLCLLV